MLSYNLYLEKGICSFISENGAVIYRGKDLYNYRSFNQVEYKEVVDYLNIDRNKEFIVCGLKSAYILKDTSEAFKKDAHFTIIS